MNLNQTWVPPSGGTSANGWTCQNCGTFVPNGTLHNCTYRFYPSPQPTQTFVMTLSDADVERIARKVVELLKAAEKE